MRSKYDNEFKVMIVELLKSGMKTKQLSQEYNLALGLINRWRREYEAQSGGFSKKRELSIHEQEHKAVKKKLKEVTLERDILKKAVSIFSKSDR